MIESPVQDRPGRRWPRSTGSMRTPRPSSPYPRAAFNSASPFVPPRPQPIRATDLAQWHVLAEPAKHIARHAAPQSAISIWPTKGMPRRRAGDGAGESNVNRRSSDSNVGSQLLIDQHPDRPHGRQAHQVRFSQDLCQYRALRLPGTRSPERAVRALTCLRLARQLPQAQVVKTVSLVETGLRRCLSRCVWWFHHQH